MPALAPDSSDLLIEIPQVWATNALRVISQQFREGVVFKGGTSLSKGWKLIDRLSEDCDRCGAGPSSAILARP